MKKVLSIVLSIAMVLCMMPAMAFAGTATAAEVNAAYSDTDGLELNRQTITGEYDDYFKVLIEQAEGRHLSNEEYFPKYMKAHIDRGAILLESRYKHAGDLDKYVLETFGIGDTV